MNGDEERERSRLLARLRVHLVKRRSPRTVIACILCITGIAGFGASFAMLHGGVGQMWARYPLAVVFAWLVFLALVRVWAERENASFNIEEHLGDLSKADMPASRAGHSARSELPREHLPKRRGWGWDWSDLLPDIPGLGHCDAEGCLFGIVILAAIAFLAGAAVTFAGFIGEAETILAEVFLDAVLLSALAKRLNRLKPRWWVAGALRQTVWPVLYAACFLFIGACWLQHTYPAAHSLGDIWRQLNPRPAPQLERER